MTWIRIGVLALASSSLACGGGSPGRGTATAGGGTATTGGGAGGKLSPFLGTWSCQYSGTYQFTGSTTVDNSPNNSSTVTVAAGSSTDLELTGLVEGSSGACGVTLEVTAANTATFSPAQQSCSFLQSDGSRQTNVRTGTFAVSANNAAALSETGTFTGTTAAGAAYAGTFQGTWSCTAG